MEQAWNDTRILLETPGQYPEHIHTYPNWQQLRKSAMD